METAGIVAALCRQHAAGYAGRGRTCSNYSSPCVLRCSASPCSAVASAISVRSQSERQTIQLRKCARERRSDPLAREDALLAQELDHAVDIGAAEVNGI